MILCFMELVLVIVLRALERLLGILIGGMLAWFGYKLFLDVPVKADSSGSFKIPGGTEIKLTRIAPGVFFSLFGTVIVFVSFFQSVQLNPAQHVSSATPQADLVQASALPPRYSGASATGNLQDTNRDNDLKLRRQMVITLNKIPELLRADLDNLTKLDVEDELRHAKLSLMQSVWDSSSWGDYATFRQWTEGPQDKPAPNEQAKNYFLSR
jgi:hypothetical protein